jgi:hypothetical protein
MSQGASTILVQEGQRRVIPCLINVGPVSMESYGDKNPLLLNVWRLQEVVKTVLLNGIK